MRNAERVAWTPGIEPLTTTAEMKAWSSLRTIRGDVQTYIERAWSRRIPKVYEELLDASMKAGNVDASLRILMAMTAMSPLTPARLKQVADDALQKLPDDIDLSHLLTPAYHSDRFACRQKDRTRGGRRRMRRSAQRA